jgi:hypothetical protein
VVLDDWLAVVTDDVAVVVEVDAAVRQDAFRVVQRIDGAGFDRTDVAAGVGRRRGLATGVFSTPGSLAVWSTSKPTAGQRRKR